mmetsp:Transcript_11261/g.13758  ORF Transcript_11261/g.13758 Transcript_11261/m.13758 type:complete len:126 (-) Transcript_11261:279-656(-)
MLHACIQENDALSSASNLISSACFFAISTTHSNTIAIAAATINIMFRVNARSSPFRQFIHCIIISSVQHNSSATTFSVGFSINAIPRVNIGAIVGSLLVGGVVGPFVADESFRKTKEEIIGCAQA